MAPLEFSHQGGSFEDELVPRSAETLVQQHIDLANARLAARRGEPSPLLLTPDIGCKTE
jgi:hypothetical protein